MVRIMHMQCIARRSRYVLLLNKGSKSPTVISLSHWHYIFEEYTLNYGQDHACSAVQSTDQDTYTTTSKQRIKRPSWQRIYIHTTWLRSGSCMRCCACSTNVPWMMDLLFNNVLSTCHYPLYIQGFFDQNKKQTLAPSCFWPIFFK